MSVEADDKFPSTKRQTMSLVCDRVALMQCQTNETVALHTTPYLTTAIDARLERGDSHVSGRSGRSMDSPSVPMKRSNDGSAFDLTHAIRLHVKQEDAQAKIKKKRSLVTKVPPRQTLGVL